MFLGEALDFSVKAIKANPVRSLLTGLGMMIGTTSVILVVTISVTSRDYILEQIQGLGSNMINAYYDFKNASIVTPYLGAGAGIAYGKLKAAIPLLGLAGDESDTAFAWQGIAGLSVDVAPQLALTADYRYFDTANFSDIDDDYSAHEIRAGVRYSF